MPFPFSHNKLDCYEFMFTHWVKGGVRALSNGMQMQEPTAILLEPEVALARQHQLMVETDLSMASICQCPDNWNRSLYLKERNQERLDFLARPVLP